MESTLTHIRDRKLVAIIRGLSTEDALSVVEALLQGGINTIEIALNNKNDFATINKVFIKFGDQIYLGAGTVLDVESAKNVIDLGASFILSPNMDTEVIEYVKRRGKISIPGGFTPSELVDAIKAGADIVKFFPASYNAFYLKAMKSPLHQIPIMAVGGIGLDNIKEFHTAGAMSFGLGSSLVPKMINDKALANIISHSIQYVNLIKTFTNENN